MLRTWRDHSLSVTLNVEHLIAYIHVRPVTLQFVSRSISTMRVFTTLIAIWSIYIFEQNVEALTCLKCDYVVQPRHCKTVMTCQDDDSCIVEKQINAFGETGYNLGCLAKRSCRNSTSSSSHCSQCCDKDLCNHAGCGEEEYPFQRGPVCYSCDNPLPEGRCHSIDVCREGEVCSLYGEDTFGTVLYTSGCMAKVHCVSHPGGVLIGRRSHMTSTLTRSHGLHDCFNCCDSDLCNKNCQSKVDGQWGSWTSWSLCTSHCNQTRTRVCDNPSPLHGGIDCPGLTTQTQGCYTDQCQIDGQWGTWTSWSLCTYHCNQTRTRGCNNPAPLHGGRDCPGLTTQTQGCYTDLCQIDGQWGSWASWSSCSSHCNQTRTRACDNPAPLHGGRDCPGLTTQTQGCYTDLCQIDGQWGSWTSWSSCTSHCNQTRTRACDNPAPVHGGSDCPGNMTQTQGCYTSSCLGTDCSRLLSKGAARLSGVYNITTPLTHTKIQVYCDMVTDGGGWTVFQRRFDGSVDFYRNFSDYENGFGSVQEEHWLGLRYMYEIASQGGNLFRLDFVRYNGSKGFDVYDKFSLGPGTNYAFHIGSRLRFNGCMSLFEDAYGTPDGNSFGTYDHDTDRRSDICAVQYHGAWWYNACYNFNPNGLYHPGQFGLNIMAYYDDNVGLKGYHFDVQTNLIYISICEK